MTYVDSGIGCQKKLPKKFPPACRQAPPGEADLPACRREDPSVAHFPKPFWRPKKGRWYVQINGKQINLGSDEKHAFARYHALMANQRQPKLPAASGIPVSAILDAPDKSRKSEIRSLVDKELRRVNHEFFDFCRARHD